MAPPPKSILELFDVESPYVTEYRRLLYRIMHHSSRTDMKSVMITSSMVAEGKSTICSFLGLTASVRKGLKTLIVDADLRLPAIARLFGLPDGPGLAEIITEGYNPKDAVQKLSVPNLEIITAGRVRGNPSEVFDAEVISQLLEEMKFYYDLILVDCTPLLPVSDPMLLAPSVDGVLLVVKAGATQQEVVKRALAIIDPKRSNILGVVLNNMNHSLPYYYNYDYYSYDYHRAGEKKLESSARGETPEEANESTDQELPAKKNPS